MTSIDGFADVGYIPEFHVVADEWLSWRGLVRWSVMGLLFLPFLQLWVVP